MKTSNHQIFYYQIKNRISRKKRLLAEHKRSSSFPFLACDTYACESEIAVLKKSDLEKLVIKSEIRSLYVITELLDQLLAKLVILSDVKINALIIGDSDFELTENALIHFLNYTQKIFAVNYKGKSNPRIKAIPLGLENKKYGTSGLLENFSRRHLRAQSRRDINLLVAWNDETYRKSRIPARRILGKVDGVFEIKTRVPYQVIHNLTQNSLFVACPRGNGWDTHRIWESLYLGAIPIVIESESLDYPLNIPYWRIEDWSELCKLTRSDFYSCALNFAETVNSFQEEGVKFMKREFGWGS